MNTDQYPHIEHLVEAATLRVLRKFPDNELIRKALTDHVRDAFHKQTLRRFGALPEIEREVLALRYGLTMDGTPHSFNEIAESLHEDALDVRVLHRGAMAELLEGMTDTSATVD